MSRICCVRCVSAQFKLKICITSMLLYILKIFICHHPTPLNVFHFFATMSTVLSCWKTKVFREESQLMLPIIFVRREFIPRQCFLKPWVGHFWFIFQFLSTGLVWLAQCWQSMELVVEGSKPDQWQWSFQVCELKSIKRNRNKFSSFRLSLAPIVWLSFTILLFW